VLCEVHGRRAGSKAVRRASPVDGKACTCNGRVKMHVVHARKYECGLPDCCVCATVRCCASATTDKLVADGALPHVGRDRLL